MERRDTGFTLVELIIALAILAIVAVGVVPAIGDIMTRNRSATLTNEFLAALNYARSEAVTRTRPVTMCRIDSTAGQCTQANIGTGKCVCVTGGADESTNGWEDGWMTFVDRQRTASVNTLQGDELLQMQPPLGGGFTIRGASNSIVKDFIRFEPNGTAIDVSNARIAICAAGTDSTEGSLRMNTARRITITATGRARAMAYSTAAAANCSL